jgi:hypothetical protein
MSNMKSRVELWRRKWRSSTKKEDGGMSDAAVVAATSAPSQALSAQPQGAGSTSFGVSLPPAPKEATPGTPTYTATVQGNEALAAKHNKSTSADTSDVHESNALFHQSSLGATSTCQSLFWDQARIAFEKHNTKQRVELTKVGDGHVDASNELQDLLKSRKRKGSGVSPSVERAIRNILVYKDISIAAATFDPTRAGPTIVRGICNILQVCSSSRTYGHSM